MFSDSRLEEKILRTKLPMVRNGSMEQE